MTRRNPDGGKRGNGLKGARHMGFITRLLKSCAVRTPTLDAHDAHVQMFRTLKFRILNHNKNIIIQTVTAVGQLVGQLL